MGQAKRKNDLKNHPDKKMWLEWTFTLALLSGWDIRSFEWYQHCVEQACNYTMQDYEYYFWWSLRTFHKDENVTIENWREYLEWKIENMKKHHHGKVTV